MALTPLGWLENRARAYGADADFLLGGDLPDNAAAHAERDLRSRVARAVASELTDCARDCAETFPVGTLR